MCAAEYQYLYGTTATTMGWDGIIDTYILCIIVLYNSLRETLYTTQLNVLVCVCVCNSDQQLTST